MSLEYTNLFNESVDVNIWFDNPNFSDGKGNNKLEDMKVMNVNIYYKFVCNESGNIGRGNIVSMSGL